MGALAPLFASPAVEKVFHGAEYDLACLKRDFGFEILNLFDTRLALRTLGMQPSGLADVLAQEFGVTLDKRYQRADWAKRPLPPPQLEYARFDTHYLLSLTRSAGGRPAARRALGGSRRGLRPPGLHRSSQCQRRPRRISGE